MKAPKLVIAGGNGFLGRHLRRHFLQLGYRVVVIARSVAPGPDFCRWDAQKPGPWAAELEGADILVNLAGRTVDCRYNEANKRDIIASRVDSTRVLGQAVASCAVPPKVWLNSSTATIYADTQGAQPANTEAAGTIGSGFSVEVATAWEQAFGESNTPSTRRLALRTSIVLGTDGGAFPVMARLARLGLCTPQGTGRQWVSWLHIQDFCRAVEFLATKTEEAGPFNLCAPNPLTNQDFNSLLCQKLRPLLRLPQPKWLLEIGAFVLRTETELILKSRKVYPERLLNLGFKFEHPTCATAVADLLSTKQAK
ncbi:TIGR01777 family oxidoreductase [Hymenobacter properus]|uniref:TIGR01777 family protein n=1 Tax=Hymenobacter properus TaxID=2791026 RepID=A0A931FJC6_9BACT|nr:TIGR01777 family oxidoreductase [Hymenobacter properus]MBF9140370.1 TIGR01777 family protein [Hymenobacter properus]MBR7719177.1 TIGR01777 family oxidoreductase [Microvirga sp. SRT04]